MTSEATAEEPAVGAGARKAEMIGTMTAEGTTTVAAVEIAGMKTAIAGRTMADAAAAETSAADAEFFQPGPDAVTDNIRRPAVARKYQHG